MFARPTCAAGRVGSIAGASSPIVYSALRTFILAVLARIARLPRRHRVLLWAVPAAALLTIGMYRGMSLRFPVTDLDGAGFADLIANGAPNASLSSNFFSAYVPFLDLLGGRINSCLDVLNATPASGSVWRGHAYVLAVPLGLMVDGLGVSGSAAGLLAISVSAAAGLVLAAAFLALRRVRLGVVVAFLALVLLWPPLSLGLAGQPYFDRLFFGFGIAAVLGTWAALFRRPIYASIAVIGILGGALTTERAALLVGFVGVVYPLALIGARVRRSQPAIIIMASGLIAMSWYVFWEIWIHDFEAVNYSESLGLAGLSNTFTRLTTDPGAAQLQTFVLAVLPLVVLCALSPRGLPIALASLAPNLLITIGGAELTGFTTHYHQMYIPILVGLAAVGVARGSERWSGAQRPAHTLSLSRFLLPPVTAAAFLVASITLWSQQPFAPAGVSDLFGKAAGSVGVTRTADEASLRWVGDGRLERAKRALWSADGRPIVAPPQLAPALQLTGVRRFQYFPFGINHAGVVIAPVAEDGRTVQWSEVTPGVFSSLPAERAKAIDSCIRQRLSAGDFEGPVDIGDGLVAFIRRVGRPG